MPGPFTPPTSCTGLGLGLTELAPLPGPPYNDVIADFDWSAPGYARLFCAFLSLAPGSPTLTPGTNPLLLAGAEPGDILASCAGPSAFLGVTIPAAAVGLAPGDDLKGLEMVSNACGVPPFFDADGDGVGLACPDNCPLTFDPAQDDLDGDLDGDLVGDECDPCTEIDGDGFGNEGLPANVCATDLCRDTAGPASSA